MTPPKDCTKCDAHETLEVIRSDTRGSIWLVCSCCATVFLVNAEGRITYTSMKP